MSDNIPFDIQTEIIKRAPVKSVIRFRTVSKSWKSLIDSSEFQNHTYLIFLVLRKPRESASLHEGMQVVIDSCIYRVAYEKIRRQNGSFTYQYMIVSFDLDDKEFKAIDLPDTITNPFTSPIRFIISKLKGSLVVIVPHREIKVWKMEPNCSFTQLFTINTSCITDIVGFRKNGELVVETQDTPGRWVFFGGTGYIGNTYSALEVYDPCSKQITHLGMFGRNGSFF
ncbi:ribonuclease H-like domain-containing protein, partial [Tanacetum coccineum]